MEFAEALNRRRMVRNYTDEPVAASALDRVAAAALRAPSAGNSQAISVVVVTEEQTRAEIARIADEPSYLEAGFDPWISKAPAHLVISVSEKVYRDRYSEPDKLGPDGRQIEWPVPYWWVDAGASLMAVLLAAVDEGLAAGFLGVHSVPDLSGLLGIPDDFHPIGVVTIGHPAPDRRSGSLDRPKKTTADVVFRDRWGSTAS
ncbi:MAG TPA: nitroreductase family protein [Acidimicrobiia bacterium]|jgi:nitroreductase|nr:nitroreductase family protein [Acidimicrobiia bacterium]